MTSNDLQQDFEFYWPAASHKGVMRIIDLRSSTKYQYGQAVKFVEVTFADDWNTKETWDLRELQDALDKEYAIPFTKDVPFKARKKLQTLALQELSTRLDPPDFESFAVDGRKINVGIATWTKRLAGVVDDDGHVVRKRAILDQVLNYLISNKLIEDQ